MSTPVGTAAPRIQVFRPTMEEFKHFSKYMEYIESTGAHKAGLAKIIPPEGWIPRKSGYEDIDLIIPHPITQIVTGRQGLYQQLNISQKSLTVKEYRKLAESKRYGTPSHFDYEDLERKYWKNITYNSPIYGADVSGSLYDDGVDEFNIQHLNTILDLVKEGYEIQIEGVNTAYLYFGMWKTTFAWHTEDMDLYSINYVHYGAPKSWYVIPPEHGRRLERLAAGFFHGSHSECPAFLRHKMTIISPHILKQYSIPYSKITQEPGEFMITFPYAYHSGFNHGFNIAESTNFALPRWIEYGKRSLSCVCRNDCVKICMDIFVRKFQPDRYELWKVGKDIGAHPEEPTKQYAAPAPKKVELRMFAKKERKKKETQKIKRHPISKLEDYSEGEKRFSNVVDSDEETKLYDVDELLKPKTPKKRSRKRKKQSVEKLEEEVKDSTSVDEDHLLEMECETKMDFEKEQQIEEMKLEESKLETETRPDEEIQIDIMNEDFVESVVEVKTEQPEIPDNESMKDNSPDKLTEYSPPKLQPFWDPFEKMKTEKIKNNSNQNEMESSKIKLFQNYPNLHKAVNSGSFSIMPLNTEIEFKETNMTEEINIPSSPKQETKSNISHKSFTQAKSSVLSQTWRCETNGLKIKFVQPKSSVLNPILSSNSPITPQTPLKDAIAADEASPESFINAETLIQDKDFQPAQICYQSPPRDSSPTKQHCGSNTKAKKVDNIDTSWAEPLKNLWQHESKNFESEIAYNEKLASIAPHCAICVLFTPMFDKNSFPSKPMHKLSYSHVKMPAFCYGDDLNTECMIDTNSLLRMDGTAPVLTCSVCKVSVHATCYGVTMLPLNSWTCTRCSKEAFEAECCLCVLRGGALKPTTDGRWAHSVCAILVSETYFENTVQKEPINVSKITPVRQRLKCRYCIKSGLTKESKGACVQCRCGRCYMPFHVTCGYMAGVIFEYCDWPEPIHMICTKHASARRKPPKRELTRISVGERVIAKHRNKRYYWANVNCKYVQEYYSILFEDNSHSTDTLPEDIVYRSLTESGTPEMNEKVRVKWSDGEIYNGIFKGSQSHELYVIEFDDGSIMRLKRKDIYAADEELPKSVNSKMSHSSERNVSFDSEAEGKRCRISNSKYS